jgi:hypothetical protein
MKVNNAPTDKQWDDLFKAVREYRGIRDDMKECIDAIKASGSKALFNELDTGGKMLGLKTYATIVTLCETDKQVKAVLDAGHYARQLNGAGRNAVNLKLIELTGYDLRGKRAA